MRKVLVGPSQKDLVVAENRLLPNGVYLAKICGDDYLRVITVNTGKVTQVSTQSGSASIPCLIEEYKIVARIEPEDFEV